MRCFGMLLLVAAFGFARSAVAAPLDCGVLKERIAKEMPPDRAAGLSIIPVASAGAAHVVGSCAGGTMRVILAPRGQTPVSTAVAGRPRAPSAGTTAPGIHQSIGPMTCVPPVQWPVTKGDPGCDGAVSADAILSAAAGIPLPGFGPVLNYLDSHGWGVQRHQDYAECRLVCTTIPVGVAFTDADLTILFSLTGVPPLGGMAKADEGRVGPGAQGFWKIEQGYSVAARIVDGNQVVCKTAKNWTGGGMNSGTSRLFQLVANYRIGSSTTQVPSQPPLPPRACTR